MRQQPMELKYTSASALTAARRFAERKFPPNPASHAKATKLETNSIPARNPFSYP